MNDDLRLELEQMHAADQAIRERAMGIVRDHGIDSREYEELRQRGRALDAQHGARLTEIVEAHGWPGRSLVGDLACRGAFFVLQHGGAALQKRFLPLVREAARAGEFAPADLALLEDRVRVSDGEPQLYGSQLTRDSQGAATLWPIEDPDRVDERRASVGLEPIAAYLQRFGLSVQAGDGADSPEV